MKQLSHLIVCLFSFYFIFSLPVNANIKTAPNLPVESFFKYTDFSGLEISPTGEYLAAKVRMDGALRLAIMETKTNKILSINHFGDENDVGVIDWVSDDRVIVKMYTRVGPLDQPADTGFLFAVNVDGSKKRQLIPTPAKPGKAVGRRAISQLIDILPDEEKYVLMYIRNSAYSTIYKVNTFTGHQREFAKSNEANSSIVLDHDNVIRYYIHWQYDEDTDINTRTFYYRASKDEDWQLHKTIVDKESEKRGNSTFKTIDIAADNKQLYIQTEKGIELYNPDSKRFKTILPLEGDAEVTSKLYSTDFNNSVLLGIKRMPGYIETSYLTNDHPDVNIRKSLSAAFPNKEVVLKGRTKDGATMLVYVYSDKVAGEYYLFDTKKNSLSFLLSKAPERKESDFADMKPFSFIARDGLEIRGYLTLPKGKSKNLPLVQVVHGGPYGVTDDWGYDGEAQFFANKGYAVMQVNYRGSGGRGNRFHYDHYLKMGKEMQDDLTDAVHWAIKEGIADKEKICIYGASYGGYAALMGVVKEPDLYKCAVPYVGVYDIAIQKDKSDTRLYDAGRRFLERAWNAYDEEFVKERSPIYHLDKLKAALFFVHGAVDRRVPIEQYEAVSKKLDEMGYPYESLIEEDEAHGFIDQDNRYNLYRKVERFLAKHLKD
ncbi:alpha/beta hydrolase family protein [Thalassomonas sp. M1454]|uniref:alpha/beta hydrolase family protein n=1 Tax=Thalassomonas sp. M1454 TaxID=2594477 RepID=UPI00117EFEE2|nr:S9 family peptidase [Thalassomonas sp. M1454]TRX52732.1 S9 family peptidase [Thalassomonas sp. M1454]